MQSIYTSFICVEGGGLNLRGESPGEGPQQPLNKQAKKRTGERYWVTEGTEHMSDGLALNDAAASMLWAPPLLAKQEKAQRRWGDLSFMHMS